MRATELEVLPGARRFVVTDEHHIGAGGQGKVYAVPFDPSLAVKLYYASDVTASGRLEAMMAIATPRDFEIRPSGTPHLQLAWPNHLVRDAESKELGGYTMPHYPRVDYLQLDVLWHPRLRDEHVPGASWLFLLAVAFNLATLAAMVHERGLVLGDVRDANFVFSPRTALVALLDCDSMPITDPRTGAHFPCRLSHPDYAPPELQPQARSGQPDLARNPDTDNFSLAVLISRLLLAGVHPFEGWPAGDVEDDDEVSIGQNIRAGRSYVVAPDDVLVGEPVSPEVMPAAVLSLARQAFGVGLREPSRRPSSSEWRAALADALEHVVDCPVHPDRHKYSAELWGCPWCGPGYDHFAPAPVAHGPSMTAAVMLVVLVALVMIGAMVALLLTHVI